MMVGCFVEVCKIECLKGNADKRKMVILGGDEGIW